MSKSKKVKYIESETDINLNLIDITIYGRFL